MSVGFVNSDGVDLGDILVRRDFFRTGGAYCWGANDGGGLGLSDTLNRSQPVLLQGSWKKIQASSKYDASAYGFCTLGSKSNGTLWAWGSNIIGNIGDNTRIDRSSPVQIGTDTWTDIALTKGYNDLIGSFEYPSAAAVRNDGTLWAWGSNTIGALGDNTIINRSSPVQIGAGIPWKKVFPKWGGFFAISDRNALYGWGFGNNYDLGDGTTLNRSSPTLLLSGVEVVDVISNISYGAPITFVEVKYPSLNNGAKYKYWGQNLSGVFGTNAPNGSQITTASDYPYNYNYIGGCLNSFCAIDNQGRLWAWGDNLFGTIGDNTRINRSSPVLIMADRRFIKVGRTNNRSMYAIESDGTLWAWGMNSLSTWSGMIGDNTIISRSSPVQVSTTNKNWIDVSGDLHIFGITSNDI